MVAALPHASNNLGHLQRTRWVPGGSTLDIGWVRCAGLSLGGAGQLAGQLQWRPLQGGPVSNVGRVGLVGRQVSIPPTCSGNLLLRRLPHALHLWPPPPGRHRGSGASKVQGHNVRENTLLSFQKAAVNHSDYIEFDVRGRRRRWRRTASARPCSAARSHPTP